MTKWKRTGPRSRPTSTLSADLCSGLPGNQGLEFLEESIGGSDVASVVHSAGRRCGTSAIQRPVATTRSTNAAGSSLASVTSVRRKRRRGSSGVIASRSTVVKISRSPERESNSRPTHYECVALPTELSGRAVGAGRDVIGGARSSRLRFVGHCERVAAIPRTGGSVRFEAGEHLLAIPVLGPGASHHLDMIGHRVREVASRGN